MRVSTYNTYIHTCLFLRVDSFCRNLDTIKFYNLVNK